LSLNSVSVDPIARCHPLEPRRARAFEAPSRFSAAARFPRQLSQQSRGSRPRSVRSVPSKHRHSPLERSESSFTLPGRCSVKFLLFRLVIETVETQKYSATIGLANTCTQTPLFDWRMKQASGPAAATHGGEFGRLGHGGETMVVQSQGDGPAATKVSPRGSCALLATQETKRRIPIRRVNHLFSPLPPRDIVQRSKARRPFTRNSLEIREVLAVPVIAWTDSSGNPPIFANKAAHPPCHRTRDV